MGVCPLEDLSKTEWEHISKAWFVSPSQRQINVLLDDRSLHDIGFIPELSKDRRKAAERNLEKKRKLIAGAKKRMVDQARDADTSRKKHRIPTGVTLIKRVASSDIEQVPKKTQVVGLSASVTIS
ncbi:hypothetical protein LWI28_023695 [Acer negundo]|uniref:Uncharacterized protein n=1 Tax=Acer negundo TaxID=4023 RepID=A0AAD5JG93_ACENE|nr:hypothetical protein LWI28_023695 [Acer negundo]